MLGYFRAGIARLWQPRSDVRQRPPRFPKDQRYRWKTPTMRNICIGKLHLQFCREGEKQVGTLMKNIVAIEHLDKGFFYAR
jgi:hypothetical protein